MRILFQGDSITDCGRRREGANPLGSGYPMMVMGQLGLEEPSAHAYINRGISGNRSVDLYARIKVDILNLKPDFISILLGVNDVWHEFDGNNGVDADKFLRIYCMLIEEIKSELPAVQILIMEPFCLRGSATEAYYDEFRAEVEKRAAMAKKVAETYGLTFLPLQAELDALASTMPASELLSDGVHPTPIGHTVLKNAWIRTFKEMTQAR